MRVILVSLLAVGSLAACASVPSESVELSMMVGERITAMQVSHEAIVQDYFRLSRERVEDFFTQRWVPQYLENFVRDADLMTILENPEPLHPDEVARIREELGRAVRLSNGDLARAVRAVQSALGDADRGQILVEAAQAAGVAIQRQRAELFNPLNAQEAEVLKEIRAAYTELRAMQDAVTNHLRSVRAVQVEQDAILRRLELLDARNQAVGAAVRLNDRIVGILGSAEDAQTAIDDVLELLERSN